MLVRLQSKVIKDGFEVRSHGVTINTAQIVAIEEFKDGSKVVMVGGIRYFIPEPKYHELSQLLQEDVSVNGNVHGNSTTPTNPQRKKK